MLRLAPVLPPLVRQLLRYGVTAGGVHGTVVSIDDAKGVVVLRIDDDKGVKMKFDRASVVRIAGAPDAG